MTITGDDNSTDQNSEDQPSPDGENSGNQHGEPEDPGTISIEFGDEPEDTGDATTTDEPSGSVNESTLVIDFDDFDDEKAGTPVGGSNPDTVEFTLEELTGPEEQAPRYSTPPHTPPIQSYPSIPVPQTGAPPYAPTKPRQGLTVGSMLLQTAIAGAIGGILAWALIEPFFDDESSGADFLELLLQMGLFSGVLGACIGICLGAVEGIMGRTYNKALNGGLIGLGIGFGGGFAGGVIGQIFFAVMLAVLAETATGIDSIEDLLVPLIIVRAISWGLFGMVIGLVQGIASRSGRRIRNGLIGGLIGGAIGGALFDPICFAVQNAVISRAIGLTIIGVCTGFAIGMIEEMTKQAWLHITSGMLTGKQFILYHENTTIGGSPSCEITIPMDKTIAPTHCVIHTKPSGNELVAQASTLLNGHIIQRSRLRDGDQIQIGETILTYSERAEK